MLDKLAGESTVASVNRLARCNFLNPTNEPSHALQAKLVDRLAEEDVATSSITPAQILMALHAYEYPTRCVCVGVRVLSHN